jgi:hypothetical protein
MYGWIKPILEFLAELFGKQARTEKKVIDAKTLHSTKTRFQGLRARMRERPPTDDMQ